MKAQWLAFWLGNETMPSMMRDAPTSNALHVLNDGRIERFVLSNLLKTADHILQRDTCAPFQCILHLSDFTSCRKQRKSHS